EDYDLSQLTRATSREELTHYFKNFHGSEGIIEASFTVHRTCNQVFGTLTFIQVLSKYSGLRLIPEIEHSPPSTYVRDNVAIMGDAAHTMSNFQQLGPGQSIEDGMILGSLLANAKTRSDIPAAMHAYDEVLRPRAHDVSEHGKRLGMLWTGMSEAGTDPDKLGEAFLKWRDEMESFDLEAHRDEAWRIMNHELRQSGNGLAILSRFQGILGLRQSAGKMSLESLHEGL
ncbi:hypothetical protein AC579_5007, partial [Pseudocercospora musae]